MKSNSYLLMGLVVRDYLMLRSHDIFFKQIATKLMQFIFISMILVLITYSFIHSYQTFI